MNKQLVFDRAAVRDADEVFALLSGLIGVEGCTWTAEYPSREDVLDDIDNRSMYYLRDNIGAIAAVAFEGTVKDKEYTSLFKNSALRDHCDIAKIGVRRDLLHQGIGSYLLQRLIDNAKKLEYDGIRLLVSVDNAAALALYQKHGFSQLCEADFFGHHWFCYELAL